MDVQNRTCKGICKKYIAIKPPNKKPRYASGQVRCQMCEIFMTQEGVKNKLYCKCCGYRVRTKPRNGLYKEKHHEAMKKNQESNIKQIANSTTEKDTESYKKQNAEKKKATLAYTESDDSVKTYYDFKDFLETDMDTTNNHQIVILKELLAHEKLHDGEIAEAIAYFNNENAGKLDVVKSFFNISAINKLFKYEIIKEYSKKDSQMLYFTLNVKLNEYQSLELLSHIDKQLEEYNNEHNIPDNEFPEIDDIGNIDWKFDNKEILMLKYNKLQKSPKTYYDLKNFIDLDMDITNNHQIVILKELVMYKKLHEGKITESIVYFNNRNPLDVNEVKLFLNTLAYNSLLKDKIIIKDSNIHLYMANFSLNAKFTEYQELILVKQLDRMLETYNSKYNIPNNEFPNAVNMGNINWKFNKKESKVIEEIPRF